MNERLNGVVQETDNDWKKLTELIWSFLYDINNYLYEADQFIDKFTKDQEDYYNDTVQRRKDLKKRYVLDVAEIERQIDVNADDYSGYEKAQEIIKDFEIESIKEERDRKIGSADNSLRSTRDSVRYNSESDDKFFNEIKVHYDKLEELEKKKRKRGLKEKYGEVSQEFQELYKKKEEEKVSFLYWAEEVRLGRGKIKGKKAFYDFFDFIPYIRECRDRKEYERFIYDVYQTLAIKKEERKKKEEHRLAQEEEEVEKIRNNSKQEYIRKEKEINNEHKNKVRMKWEECNTKEEDLNHQKDIIERKYEDDLQEIEGTYNIECKKSIDRWVSQMQERRNAFISKMDQDYPPKIFNEWIGQFWSHPHEPNGAMCASQKNTLIGEARLDLKTSSFQWQNYKELETARSVLGKYALFGFGSPDEVKKNLENLELVLPYTISNAEGSSLYLSHNADEEGVVKTLMNSFAIRKLCATEPEMMELLLLVPSGHGMNSFVSIMQVDPEEKNRGGDSYKLDSIIIGKKEHSTKEEINEEIKRLQERLLRNLKKVGTEGKLYEYNQQNPMKKNKFTTMLMLGYPNDKLSEDSITKLRDLQNDCGKAGFGMIISGEQDSVDSLREEQKKYAKEMLKKMTCMELHGKDQLKIIDPKDGNLIEKEAVITPYLISEKDISVISEEIREKAVEHKKMQQNITLKKAEDLFPHNTEKFQKEPSDGVDVPIGWDEDGNAIGIQLNDERPHGIIIGTTGEGKTNLLEVFLTNALLRYSAEELAIYLVDFKHGNDYGIYTQYYIPDPNYPSSGKFVPLYLPVFRAIALTEDVEMITGILDLVEKEIVERAGLMPPGFKRMVDFNRRYPDQKRPTVILIIDELNELIEHGTSVDQERIMNCLRDLAHRARQYDVHILLAGQDIEGLPNYSKIANQSHLRAALKCNDMAQVENLMGKDGKDKLNSVESESRGHMVFTNDGNKTRSLVKIVKLYADNDETEHVNLLLDVDQYSRLEQPKEKGEPITTRIISERLQRDISHPLCYMINYDRSYWYPCSKMEMYIGIKASKEIRYQIRPTGNVWIAGEMKEAEKSLQYHIMLSSMFYRESNRDKVLYSFVTGAGDGDRADFFLQTAKAHPDYFGYQPAEEYDTVLDRFYEIYEQRINGNNDGREYWWFLFYPEKIHTASNGANISHLLDLIEHGYEQGIHIVIHTATRGASQQFNLQKNYFADIICLQMPGNWAEEMIQERDNRNISGYNALHISGGYENRFHIYEEPDARWVNQINRRISEFETGML